MRCRDCDAMLTSTRITRCRDCWKRDARERGRQRILSAIRRWVEIYGDVPSATDWNPYAAARMGHVERARVYEAGEWPSSATAVWHFGSWNAAITAAGFAPRPVGDGRVRRVAA